MLNTYTTNKHINFVWIEDILELEIHISLPHFNFQGIIILRKTQRVDKLQKLQVHAQQTRSRMGGYIERGD